jgi:hypothetical protein
MRLRTTIRKAALPAALIFGLNPAGAGTIDRLAVTVGMHVISESDVIADIRLAAFIDGTRPEITIEAKRKAADRLVDQYLVLQDADLARAPLPTEADLGPMLQPIRARYGSDMEFSEALRQAGITEHELRAHLLAGLQMLRYADLRFRPEVLISEQDLEDYYEQLKPKLGPNPPRFEEAREEVERLVSGERTLQAMDAWLSMARSDTSILYHEEAFR